MNLPKIKNHIGVLLVFASLMVLDRVTALNAISKYGINDELNILRHFMGISDAMVLSFILGGAFMSISLYLQHFSYVYTLGVYYSLIAGFFGIFQNITYPTHLNQVAMSLFVFVIGLFISASFIVLIIEKRVKKENGNY